MSDSLKIFVVGSNGYVARHLVPVLRSSGMEVKTVSSSGAGDIQLDLLESTKFPFDEIGCNDVVIFAAAISSPDYCRDNYELAYAVNVTGTIDFVERCLERGARVLFFSSDTVYGAYELECDEAADPKPVGEYAVMKFEVEKRFAANPKFKALRLSYVFSKEDKFTKYLGGCISGGDTAEIYHPIFRRAVYLHDLLDLLKLMCISWDNIHEKVINVSGPELKSRADIASLYKELVSPNLKVKIVAPPSDFFVARPQNINIACHIIEKILGRKTRTLHEAMIIEFNGEK